MNRKAGKTPGYFNTKPLLKSIRNIRETLGHQDVCIQTNQVAILFLEEQAIASNNQEEFIKVFCRKYKISLGTGDFDFFKKVQYKSYILQTYNLVEPLFKGLITEYKYYNCFKGNWKTKDGANNLDPFNQLIINLNKEKSDIIKSYPEYYLLDYYRLIRNSIVHLQEDEDEHVKTLAFYKKYIKDKKDFFHSNYNLLAPNEPENISFKDFVLYTRVLKYFSNILNDVCFPELNTLSEALKTDTALKKSLAQSRNMNYEGALLKRINVLRGFFTTNFGTSNKVIRDDFCRNFLTNEGINYERYL